MSFETEPYTAAQQQPVTNEQLVAQARAILDAFNRRVPFTEFVGADGKKVKLPVTADEADAARRIVEAFNGNAADAKPSVINIGGGKIAIFDPTTKKTEVRDLGSKTAEEQALELEKLRADIERTRAATAADTARTANQDAPITPADREATRGLTAAQTARTKAETAAIETPAQRQTRELAGIQARADAERKAAFDLVKSKIDAGIELTEKEKLELQSTLNGILARTQGEIARINAQFTHELGQPDRDREFGLREQTLREGTAAREENARIQREQQEQTRRRDQAGILGKQAEQGGQIVDRLVKSGVAPSRASLNLMLGPLQAAFQLMQQGAQSGQVDPTHIPQPTAPKPPGVQPGAPAPVTAAAPAPAAAPQPVAPTGAPRPGGV